MNPASTLAAQQIGLGYQAGAQPRYLRAHALELSMRIADTGEQAALTVARAEAFYEFLNRKVVEESTPA